MKTQINLPFIWEASSSDELPWVFSAIADALSQLIGVAVEYEEVEIVIPGKEYNKIVDKAIFYLHKDQEYDHLLAQAKSQQSTRRA